MPLVGTKEMFKKAYEGGYAIGAFNVNNMEIVQGITEAAAELQSPVILQCSAGARKYAKHEYLVHLVKAALEINDIPIALHLDHGADFFVDLGDFHRHGSVQHRPVATLSHPYHHCLVDTGCRTTDIQSSGCADGRGDRGFSLLLSAAADLWLQRPVCPHHASTALASGQCHAGWRAASLRSGSVSCPASSTLAGGRHDSGLLPA